MTSIRTQTPPDVSDYPKINIFNKEDFDQALWQNGYEVTLEEAVACPCKGSSADHKPTCSNCLGTGWAFVNPIETKALMTSINKSTKYKDWSPEFIGTIAITFLRANRCGFMDKVTMNKNFGVISENLTARENLTAGYQKFVFGTYKALEIRSVFIFNGTDKKLIKLDSTDYRISPTNAYVIDLKSTHFPTDFNGKVSISYIHKMSYNIMDIPHDMRITKEWDDNGKKKMFEMPVQAIARKSQYELGKATNYEGNNIQNNSYK